MVFEDTNFILSCWKPRTLLLCSTLEDFQHCKIKLVSTRTLSSRSFILTVFKSFKASSFAADIALNWSTCCLAFFNCSSSTVEEQHLASHKQLGDSYLTNFLFIIVFYKIIWIVHACWLVFKCVLIALWSTKMTWALWLALSPRCKKLQFNERN